MGTGREAVHCTWCQAASACRPCPGHQYPPSRAHQALAVRKGEGSLVVFARAGGGLVLLAMRNGVGAVVCLREGPPSPPPPIPLHKGPTTGGGRGISVAGGIEAHFIDRSLGRARDQSPAQAPQGCAEGDCGTYTHNNPHFALILLRTRSYEPQSFSAVQAPCMALLDL